mmetsp:Transcript_34357/g.60782  ORF Transcript_34357/g.60782 Transcript_34357/m.60782 type:complete len:369 (-) Transcript_34357:76-1182(-)
MRVIAFLVACLACTGYGRRLQSTEKHESKTSGDSTSPANSLAGLLLSSSPAAGWHVTAPGNGHAMRNVLGDRARSIQQRPVQVPLRRAGVLMRSVKEATDSEGHAIDSAMGPQAQSRILNMEPKVLASMVAAFVLVGLAQSASAAGFVDDVVEQANNSGFVQAFLLIFASEIGDKTFFLAGLLAAKYSILISAAGSIGALSVMTVISTIIGQVFHSVPESITQGIPFDDYAAIAAFTYFGAKTLYDAFLLPDGDSSGIDEEREEAEEIVAKETSEEKRRDALAAIAQTFGLVFAAEIGDRSFLSTIALSAALDPVAVSGGAIAGHAVATGLAVGGGSVMSKYLSEKVIGYIGGTFFLVFAATTALGVF